MITYERERTDKDSSRGKRGQLMDIRLQMATKFKLLQ